MKRTELVEFLKSKNFAEENFNSNNAWGFGGARGKRYKKNGITVTIAKAGTRHQGEFPFITVVNTQNERILDKVPNSKTYEKVKDLVNSLSA